VNIKQLDTTPTGSIAACGEFERVVHIWDLSAHQQLAVLDTPLDFGGVRLAITNDANYCITGAYINGGVYAYAVSSRTQAWCRKDLKKVQYIRASCHKPLVYCCFDEQPCHLLDVQSGETIAKWKGVRCVWESPYERLLLLEKHQLALHPMDSTEVVPIARETFAVLDVAFANGLVCISESGGPVRCLNTRSGKEVWRWTGKGLHFLTLGYSEAANAFFGVCWPPEYGGLYKLMRLEKDTGEITEITVLENSSDFAFYSLGSRLLLTDGSIIDVATGNRESVISFTSFRDNDS